jgi:DNA-binding Xre family transcriptional regulator
MPVTSSFRWNVSPNEMKGSVVVQWNLRLVAASRGIWKATEMQALLSDHGLRVSAGKMSGLWSGQPASVKLSDLDVLCRALSCRVDELLVQEDDHRSAAADPPPRQAQRRSGQRLAPRVREIRDDPGPGGRAGVGG